MEFSAVAAAAAATSLWDGMRLLRLVIGSDDFNVKPQN